MIAYNDDGNLVELGGKTTSLFGTCSTAADVAAKTVTLPNLDSLRSGLSVVIKFTNSNTAENPTLQINSTGAKPIYRYGTNKAGINPYDSWVAGSIQTFTYDGTNWVLNEQQDLSYLMPIEITKDAYDQLTQDELLDRTFFIIDYESVVDVPASSVEYDNTSSGMSATNVQRAIDELSSSIPSGGSSIYGTCTTSASTAQKDVTASGVTELTTGLSIIVKFTNSNTASSPTLAVNSLTAKPIYKYGSTTPGTTSFDSWEAGSMIQFTYDGTAWVMNDQINSSYFRPIEILKADYDLLSPAEIQNKVFFIADYSVNENVPASEVSYSNVGTSLSSTSVQGAVTELSFSVDNTYTKTEVDSIISAVENGRFEYVTALPTTGIKTNVIYLVPKSDTQTDNIKDEYINVDGTTTGWEKIGDTEIDLSNYVQGSGTSGYLAKFNSGDSITSGPQLGDSTLTYLRNDGTWNEPVDNRFVTLTKVQYDALGTSVLNDGKYYFITDWTPSQS